MIEKATETSRRLVALRDRLAALEAEAVQIRSEIAECIRQLSGTVGTLSAPLASVNLLASRILTLMHEYPESAFSPSDISNRLGTERDRERVRMTLFRLMRAGRVKRIAHGRYRAVPLG